MTRLSSTLWASVAASVSLASGALADTPPVNDQDDTTTTTTTTPSSPTTTTPTDPSNTDQQSTTTHIDLSPRTEPGPRSSDYFTAPAPAPAPVVVVHDDDREHFKIGGLGVSIAAGGGASGFTNQAMRDTTRVGGDWDVTATFGTRSPIAIEGSYIGSAQAISALGLDDNAVLVGNGVQGALRLNTTIDMPIQPFLFAGAAWRRYDLTNTSTNTSDVAGSDDVVEFPMGVGLAAHLSGAILDIRGEFRASTMEDLMPDPTSSNSTAELHRWGAKATIGYEF